MCVCGWGGGTEIDESITPFPKNMPQHTRERSDCTADALLPTFRRELENSDFLGINHVTCLSPKSKFGN